MKLIVENLDSPKFITEDIDGEKRYIIEGIFLQSNIKNKNGRIYPEEVMDKAVRVYTENFIEQNRAYGELNHPDSPKINLDRVSHMITSLKKEGNDYVGRAIITDTPMGNIVKGLLKAGANLGVSSRGVGSIKETAESIIVEDFIIATAADIVADPSAPNAFVSGIMEDVEWFLDGSGCWVKERAYAMRDSILRKKTKKELEESAILIFENFLKSIR